MAQKNTEKTIKLKDIEKLLSNQTSVILSAVDKKLSSVDGKISVIDEKITALDRRIGKLEIKVDQRFNELITTLDRFLKRLTDMEDEFEIMKLDINRLKKIVKEKLGVNL